MMTKPKRVAFYMRISAVTDTILDEITEWQNRPLDPVYPLVFFDALRVKVRDEGTVRNKAVYIALSVLWPNHAETVDAHHGARPILPAIGLCPIPWKDVSKADRDAHSAGATTRRSRQANDRCCAIA